ncbi:hypothetical protein [Stygiolobus sp. CP8521M]
MFDGVIHPEKWRKLLYDDEPLYRRSAMGVKEEDNYECDREETEHRRS